MNNSSVIELRITERLEQSSRWHVLLAAWLGLMFDALDANIFVIIMFPALAELSHTHSHAVVGAQGGIILATFMVGWAIGSIVFGMVSDYIGRTKTMIFTILLYATSTGLCALSHTWLDLAFCRFLVGCGIGGEQSLGIVLLSETFKKEARLHAISIMTTAFGVGYLLTGFLNAWLAPYGWRALYLVGIVPALLTLYIRAKLKEPLQFQLLREYRGRVARGEIQETEKSDTVFEKLTMLFAPINRPKIITVALLSSTCIVGCWAVMAWIPPWINQLTGTLAVSERTNATIILNLGSILSGFVAGTLLLKFGRRKTFLLAFGGALICSVCMFLSVKSYGVHLLLWCFVFGFFEQLPFQCVFIYAPELFDARIRGTAIGVTVQAGRLAGALAALLGGQLIACFGGSYALAGACIAAFYLVGIVTSFFVPQTKGEVALPDELVPSASSELAKLIV